jgi:CheY-like chemotaxis protein
MSERSGAATPGPERSGGKASPESAAERANQQATSERSGAATPGPEPSAAAESSQGPSEVTPIEVLLIEDDPGDVLMTREAFAEHKVTNRLNVVSDGDEALAYLRRQGRYNDAVRPDLVLLDLNLPRRDGREVLAEIKSDEELHQIPVVVLTTSQADEDILRSYQLHANAYVTKPVDFDRFINVVRRIDDFFVSVVKLPPRS